MLRRQDVGHRVVVRRIVGATHERPLYSDALGELVALTETDLTIATTKGTITVPLREVHRAKRVPVARRPPAADVIALELAANEAWPAPVQARLGSWILRAADNWTGRANSALAVGDPDRTLEQAIDGVVRWYAARGQRPLINAPMPLAAPVNAALDERGWTSRPLTLVQTARLSAIKAEKSGKGPGAIGRAGVGGRSDPDSTARGPHPTASAPTSGRTELAATPPDDWLAMVADHKGTLPQSAVRVLTAVPEKVFASVRDARGDLLAIGRAAVTGPDRWLGISLLQTAPHARRRGLARQMLQELAQWGAQQGATRAYLQVEERNTAAVALYAAAGFTTHHTYLTREAPSG